MDSEAPQRTPIASTIHFHNEIPLPQGSTVTPYRPHHTAPPSKNQKKNKKKYDEFTYYSFANQPEKIVKVLYRDEQTCLLNSYYPFINPISIMTPISQLIAKNIRKVTKTQCAYIGHSQTHLIVKKVSEIKLGPDGNEFDTNDDNFEQIQISNRVRFEQMLKILVNHPRAGQISIRVIVEEGVNGFRVIDYQFFRREQQIKEGNAFKGK